MLLLNNLLVPFFFIGIYYFGKILNKIFYLNFEKNFIFFTSLILFLIASFVNLSFFFSFDNIYILKCLYYIFVLISIININDLIFKIKSFIIFLYKKEKRGYYYLFLSLIIIFFLLSFLPPTDPDSLDYHLGAPNKWMREGGFYEDYYWLNYRLIGFGEFLNYFGLLLNISNFGSFTQFLYLMIFCHFLNTNNIFEKSQIDKNLIYLAIMSMPVILSLIYTQKFFLAPSLIVVSTFIYLQKNLKKPENINFFFIISSIYFSFLIKINFLIYFFLINIVFLKFINKKLFLKITLYNIILIVIIFPFYIRNYHFYGDPISPFLEFLKINPDISYINFANYLREFETDFSSIFSTLATVSKNFIPLNFNHLTTFFGIFLIYFFFQNKNKYLKIYLYFGILIILFHFIIGQLSSRYLLVAILLISIYLIINLKNINLIKYLIFCQVFIVISFSLYPIYSYMSDHKKYLNNFAYEHDESIWLNHNLNGNKYISDIRSTYYLNDNHINYLNYLEQSKKSVALKNIDLRNFIKKNDIFFISLKTFSFDDFHSGYKYINDCFIEIEKSKFEIKTRKPIFMRTLNTKFLSRRILKKKHEDTNC